MKSITIIIFALLIVAMILPISAMQVGDARHNMDQRFNFDTADKVKEPFEKTVKPKNVFEKNTSKDTNSLYTDDLKNDTYDLKKFQMENEIGGEHESFMRWVVDLLNFICGNCVHDSK